MLPTSSHAAMPTNIKYNAILPPFSPDEIAAAIATAEPGDDDTVDWSRGVVTPGGGVKATLTALHHARRSRKEPVAVHFSPEVLRYFRAQGKGWQIRMDEALKEWIKMHAPV